MTRWTPLPIVGGAYQDDVLPWSEQDCLNYLPVIAERTGTRSQTMLRDAPGLDLFADDLVSAPIRGLYDVEGRLLAVAGTTLYKVSTAGAPTSLGTIPGVGRVTFAHNQVSGGYQVAIANGQSGYVYDTRDDTLVQITDDAFPGFKSVAFKDQYLLGVEPSGRYWFHSDLADALSYSTLDRAEAEVAPDRIQLVIPSGDDVVVLGERTGQFFFNTGDAEGTFENRPGTAMTVGAASPWCAANLDNTVYWLGHDGSVYRLAGYTPQRVSTFAIEQAIARCDIAQAFAFTFEDRGHKVFYLTLPDGHTWGFDVAMQEWHRRGSYGLARWRLSALVKSGRTWIGGDYATGLLYALNWNTSHENGEPLDRRRIGGVIHDDDNAVMFNGFRVVFNTGVDDLTAPMISGSVPDGVEDQSVSGAYTVTGGLAPYSAITVTSGAFPAGLTLNPDGTYSGAYTTPGSYAWTVGGTDALGQPFSAPDSATVLNAVWWVTNSGSIALDDDLYISQNPLSFGAATTRTPNITPGYGPKGVAVDVVLVANNSGTGNIERITDMTAPVTTTLQGPFPAVRHIRVIDGVVFQIPLAGTTYLYSTDDGATWLSGTVPGSPDMADIARLDNGRWLTLVSGLGGGFYYSDVPLPTVAGDWTFAGVSNPGGAGHADGYIAVSGNAAVSFGTANVKRTDDGATWVAVTGPGDVDRRDGLSINGVFICQSAQNGGIRRSTDAGLTWSTVVFTTAGEVVQRLETGGGAAVACTNSGQMWVSTDNGATWTQSTTPGANGKRAAYVISSV